MSTLVVVFASAWVVATVHAVSTGAPRPGLAAGMTTNPLSPEAPPPAAFLLDTALERLTERTDYGGESGQVRVIVQQPGDTVVLPDSLEAGVVVEFVSPSGDTVPATAPLPAGVWNVLLRARNSVRLVPDLTGASLVPLTE